MADRDLFRPPDDATRALCRALVHEVPSAALATLDPASGHPGVSLVTVATDHDGTPLVLLSGLAWHTQALAADPRAGLLFARSGRGDPLAHPRLSLQVRAETVQRDGPDHARLRARFLARHPKAALYADFPDFRLLRLPIVSGALNGGFGKAFAIAATDLTCIGIDPVRCADAEPSVREALGPALLADLARRAGLAQNAATSAVAIDALGIDLHDGERLARLEFDEAVLDPARWPAALEAIAARVPTR